MRRWSPGTGLLFVAFVLSFLISISVPYIVDFDVVRIKFATGATASTAGGTFQALDQLRLGIWGYCAHDNSYLCEHTGLAYSLGMVGQNGASETIKPSWTRGLVMAPVATGFIFLALVLSFSEHLGTLLIASLLSFMGALVIVIFMAINIALYVYVHNKAKHLGVSENTDFGPAFWMALVTLLLTLFAGLIVCFFRRRERNALRADNYVADTSGAGTTGYGRSAGRWGRFGRKY